MALAADGTLWMTGYNSQGQLGLGDTKKRNTFTRVNLPPISAIAIGAHHSIALAADGTLWMTGYNSQGQLGLGDIKNSNTFTRVNLPNFQLISAIAAGRYHSMALAADGTLWMTGLNNEGQLCLGDITNRNIFTQAVDYVTLLPKPQAPPRAAISPLPPSCKCAAVACEHSIQPRS